MRFALATGLVALGYALIYYAAGMFQDYDPADTSDTYAPPLSVLFGIPGTGKVFAKPPLAYKETS